MFSRLLKARGAGYARGCLVELIASALVIPLGCVCIGVPLWVTQNNYYDSTTEALILAVPMAGFVLTCLGGALGVGWWMLSRRAQQLDAAFAPLGLTGKMYLTNGRQYHGPIGGRPADVYFQRGPTLEIYLSTTVKTRLSLGAKDRVGAAVAGWLKREPFDLGSDYAAFTGYALDEPWARALLDDAEVKAAIQRLMTPVGGVEIRQLFFQPEAVQLRLAYTNLKHITAENARQWLDDLRALARAAEALPPPAQTAEASQLERNAQSNRGAFVLPAIGVVLAIICGSAVCVLIPAFLLIAAEGR